MILQVFRERHLSFNQNEVLFYTTDLAKWILGFITTFLGFWETKGNNFKMLPILTRKAKLLYRIMPSLPKRRLIIKYGIKYYLNQF